MINNMEDLEIIVLPQEPKNLLNTYIKEFKNIIRDILLSNNITEENQVESTYDTLLKRFNPTDETKVKDAKIEKFFKHNFDYQIDKNNINKIKKLIKLITLNTKDRDKFRKLAWCS